MQRSLASLVRRLNLSTVLYKNLHARLAATACGQCERRRAIGARRLYVDGEAKGDQQHVDCLRVAVGAGVVQRRQASAVRHLPNEPQI